MTGTEEPAAFRLAYVPGVTPTKWVRIWQERVPDVPLVLVQAVVGEAAGMLRAGDADAALLRLPVDKTELSAIPLYTETSVVVIPKDHEIAAAEEVSPADLAEYIVLHPLDDSLEWESPPGLPAVARPETVGDAVELVAAGIGLLVVPQSLARLHHRKDLTYRPMSDVPESGVALSWPVGEAPDLVEELIGIVRGRTVNSSRGRGATAAAASGTPSTSKGKQQAASKQNRTASGGGSGRPKAASGRSAGKSGSGGGKKAGSGKSRRRS